MQVNIRVPQRILALLVGLFLSIGAFAQQITVNGNVKDGTGEGVIGATVRIVGQQGGVITDFDGNFTLKCDKGAQLQISSIGYQTATVAAAETVNVLLKDDSEVLNEVVVIGYGVAKKNDLTGSVTAIKPDEKNHGLQTTAQDMIQGKIAGVNVNSSTGEPGGGAQIRIRGGASLNASNDPLIVIDGMPMDNSQKGTSNPLALVNPNDIESFTVLKDASATAIYGSRGSNGVIIIVTKKGRRNQAPSISYNATLSLSSAAKKLDVMNASQYIDALKQTYTGETLEKALAGLGDPDGVNWDDNGNYIGPDTDWQSAIYRTGVSQDHNVSVSGGVGNDKWAMPYRVSVGYTGQNGTLKGSGYNRFTAGFSLSPSLLKDHLTLNVNGKFTYSKTKPGNQSAIGSATSMDPTRPITSTNERYANWGGYWEWTKAVTDYDATFPYARNDDAPNNPVEQINNYNFNKSAKVLMGNFEADYKIHGFEDLHLHMNLSGEYSYGGEYTNASRFGTQNFYWGNGKDNNYSGNTAENTEKRYNLVATAYVQYLKDFAKIHSVNLMAGYEYAHMKYWGNSWSQTRYPDTWTGKDDDGNPQAGTTKSYDTANWKGQTFLVSWYGRFNYTLMDRYLFTFTGRFDGSSRFAEGHRWGFFPSAAFAWRIKDESFLKDVESVSDLKLRLSWGKTGQQDTGKEYYTPTYKMSTSTHYLYPVGGSDGILYKPLVYNNDLTWETTTTWNAGIDYGMFNQRLTFTIDAYYRKTTNLLCTPTIPAGMNFDNAMMLNAGSLKNTGIELAISGKPIQSKDWYVELGVNAAYNKNKITELYGGRDMIEAGIQVGQNQNLTYHKVGQAANAFYVFQQVYDETGRPIMGCYVDRNGDGTIDDNDRYFYKNISAPWTGGFYFKVSYKNWDLGTNMRASFGNYVYNGIEAGKVNSYSDLYNTKGYYNNSTTKIVNLGWTSYNYPLSDYFVQNASFLKCDNITLGYNFSDLFKAGSFKGLGGRIYASISNVFTITKYKGLDPEQVSGYEGSVYPRSRTYLLGLSLNF